MRSAGRRASAARVLQQKVVEIAPIRRRGHHFLGWTHPPGLGCQKYCVERRKTRGVSRGTTGSITKNFRATPYFWIMLVSLKDLPLVISPAIFSDAATRMTLGGLLYAAYSIPPVIALPNMDNSSNIIDISSPSVCHFRC